MNDDQTTEGPKKPLTPLQAMAQQSTKLYDNILSQLSDDDDPQPKDQKITAENRTHIFTIDKIIECPTDCIKNWAYNDRPIAELGDLESLAKDMKLNGQQQPCLVRPLDSNKKYHYELIVGERRWRAAEIANIPLKIIVCKLNDNQAALCQASENSNRKDLSNYAKGISFAKLLDNNILTLRDLETKLLISKSHIHRLISFSKIPEKIAISVGDLSKISAKMAYEIVKLSNSDPENIERISLFGNKLTQRNFSVRNLYRELKKLSPQSEQEEQIKANTATEVRSKNGRHLFTWRKDSNSNISISFPKDIRFILDKTKLEKAIKKTIEEQLLMLN